MKRLRWLACLAWVVFLVTGAPRAASATVVLGGSPAVAQTYVDGATGILFFDLGAPITQTGTVTGFQIYTPNNPNTDVGQVQLELFRPTSSAFLYLGSTPMETVTWGGVNTFAPTAPISVQAGDLIAFYYPVGTYDSIDYAYPSTNTVMWNDNYATNSIPSAPQTNLPNLYTSTAYYGPFTPTASGSGRLYSVQALGTVPEPSLMVLALGGLILSELSRRPAQD